MNVQPRSGADRLLVVEAIVVHALVVAALRVVRFGRILRWVSRPDMSESALPAAGDELENRIVWAVRTATVIWPRGRTCLTEAVAVSLLLGRRNRAAALHIGVARSHDGRSIAAHAWVARGARTLIGGDTPGSYKSLGRITGRV
jgi:hypothetical protein